MSLVDLLKRPTRAPDDLTALNSLAERGAAPERILAVVAKSEGNGCVNDFSRTLSAHVWHQVLPSEAVTVISGGTEGVLSPHVTVLFRDPHDHGQDGLVAGTGRTAPIGVDDLGRMGQVQAVRAQVRRVVDTLGVPPEDVHFVVVKCPLLTSEQIASARADGIEPVTSDTYESMAFSRAAAALGVALALGEVDEQDAAAALAGAVDVWSAHASVSAGAELDSCHVVVLANRGRSGRLRVRHTVMRDAIDIEPVQALLQQITAEGGHVVQLFAKAEADPSGSVRGRRHTMLTDSDLNSTRHARAAVGGLLAALVGDPCVYVSGGAEHQGPRGGGPVAVVYEVPR